MSEIRHIESQSIASPEPGMTVIAVLCWAADGWRCYRAVFVFDVKGDWDAQKAEAARWTQAYGNKLSKAQARRYFSFPEDMEFAA